MNIGDKGGIRMTPQEKLKALRKERNLTTQELGELCGMLQSTISKLENGKRKMTLETLSILSKALNVSINEFLDTDEEPDVQKEPMTGKDKQELLQNVIKSVTPMEEKASIQNEKAISGEKEDIAVEDDITEELNVLMQKFYSNNGGPLFFNGAPLDGEALEELEESLKFAIRGLKQKNLKRKQQKDEEQ